jgi:hypothetical protein
MAAAARGRLPPCPPAAAQPGLDARIHRGVDPGERPRREGLAVGVMHHLDLGAPRAQRPALGVDAG